MYNANFQKKYVKSNVESKILIRKWSILNVKTWKYNPLNLNVNFLRKSECTGQKVEYCTRKVEWRKYKIRCQTTNVG